MILATLLILFFAYGVSSHKEPQCVAPLDAIHINRHLFSGTWYIQDTYSESGIPPGPCLRLDLTVSPEYKFEGLHSWKEWDEIRSLHTPEVDPPPNADPTDTKIIYVNINNDTVRGWFLGVDYDKYGIFYGCTGVDIPYAYLWTREQTRNEDIIKNVTAYGSRRVILPKKRRRIDQTQCEQH
nr:unnamed protein product [Callosobruchus analis]